MTILHNGHTTVDTSLEPDGRVRMSVKVDGEEVAAPTFAAADFVRAAHAVVQPVMPASTRDAALESITNALGLKQDERPHWPDLVLQHLEADGLTITHTTGDGND